jgi:hypothetical protein
MSKSFQSLSDLVRLDKSKLMAQVFDQKQLDSAPEVCAADPSIRFYLTKAAEVGRNWQASVVDLH